MQNTIEQPESAGAVSSTRLLDCAVCRTTHPADDITHLKIYVAGSEGVNVCLTCRQTLTEVLRGMMRAEHAGMKRGYLAAKQVAAAKQSNNRISNTA